MAAASKVGVKLISVVIGIPISIATRKLVERAWALAHPDDPPRKPSDQGVRILDAVAWGALSAAGIVAADLLTRRSAEVTYSALTGNPPPPGKQAKHSKNLEKTIKKTPVTND